MNGKMSPAGQELLDDIRAIKAGAPHSRYSPEQLLVLVVRKDLKKSQVEFAKLLGVPVGTIRDWEQGRKQPGSAAITLLKVVEKHPDILEEIAA
ncbi:MAG: type II toxin-antitoxin system MqsA family antitoxin [Gammaproteobacteria bacterium]|jgi:putative transcriptional regulator|nr:type II toxin-antitoxin system MqsA family antitoxin [Gammaproteobacteria bacterium]MBT6044075.1 type II toxin-antitoxin system MqsA family antitoxin [Gammaproteobacteria bacterium]